MANQPSYIPAKDADFDNWFNNFNTLLTATPVAFGLTAPEAVIVDGQWDLWHPAYVLATNPATRTQPTVQAKTIARLNAVNTVRPYAQAISRNQAVSDALKLSIGVNLPNNVPVPIPPITDVPSLILDASLPGQTSFQYRSSSDPTSKAKPFGVIQLELRRGSGAAPIANPDDCTPVAFITKTPFIIVNAPIAAGQVMTFFARWQNRSGASGQAYSGPWSAQTVVIAN